MTTRTCGFIMGLATEPMVRERSFAPLSASWANVRSPSCAQPASLAILPEGMCVCVLCTVYCVLCTKRTHTHTHTHTRVSTIVDTQHALYVYGRQTSPCPWPQPRAAGKGTHTIDCVASSLRCAGCCKKADAAAVQPSGCSAAFAQPQ